MRYKRITALLLNLVMTALMCSCGNADSKRYIAVIVKSVNSDFFVNMQKGVESAATEYNVTVTFEGPENEEDYVTQNLMIDAAVKNGADAILLSAINYEKSAEAVNSAARKGVKVIAIDSAVNSQSVSLFIGTDNKEAGRTAAKAACEGFSEMTDINIGVLNYFESTENGIQREEGFREYVDSVSNAKIAASVNVDSNIESATAGAVKMLMENPQINVLVGFNEWMSLGVGYAIEQLGAADTVKGVGFDANVVSVGMLETGEMDTLLVQNPFAIGYLGVQKASEIISGDLTDSDPIYTSVTEVTRDNIYDSDIQKILFSFS